MTKFDPNWFKPKTPATKGFVRIGGPHDGGYVLVDDLGDLENVISIGVGSDVSFDLELAEKRSAIVTLIDGTVSGPPVNHDLFDFIQDNWDEERVKISEFHTDSGCFSKHDYLILKFDCEGAEWKCLPKIKPMELARYTQIVCEFHDIDQHFNAETLNRLKVFHELVHVHACNFAPTFEHDGKVWPKTIECTFLRRDRDTFADEIPVLPRLQDSPCDRNAPDIPIPIR
jgi:hypothetical protein